VWAKASLCSIWKNASPACLGKPLMLQHESMRSEVLLFS
jgi:hypothetical protein